MSDSLIWLFVVLNAINVVSIAINLHVMVDRRRRRRKLVSLIQEREHHHQQWEQYGQEHNV